MIITKKALPRRTFLRGLGATRRAAAARRDGARDDRPRARRRPRPVAAPRLRLHADGLRHRRAGRRPATDTLGELSPILQLAGAGQAISSRCSRTWSCRTPTPARTRRRTRRSSARATAKQTESTDYYLGTTVDQIAAQADRAADAAAVAGAGDGHAADRRPVRQRLRLRLPEQPVVVVADDAAAGRGASAARVRAPVRRGRQHGRPARGAAPRAPACSTWCSDDITRLQKHARPGGPRQGRPVSRHRARRGAAHPEGRGGDARSTRCRISTARSACPPRTPTTRG